MRAVLGIIRILLDQIGQLLHFDFQSIEVFLEFGHFRHIGLTPRRRRGDHFPCRREIAGQAGFHARSLLAYRLAKVRFGIAADIQLQSFAVRSQITLYVANLVRLPLAPGKQSGEHIGANRVMHHVGVHLATDGLGRIVDLQQCCIQSLDIEHAAPGKRQHGKNEKCGHRHQHAAHCHR